MNNLISIEKLIKEAKKKGVSFGKGDPYNRLRYYTKIGWLPHAVRQKEGRGKVKAHYPHWSISRLVLIEDLKNYGLSNEEISKKLAAKGGLNNILNLLKGPEYRNQIISYTTLAILIFVLFSELNIIKLGKSKSQLIDTSIGQISTQILDGGTAFVPRNKSSVFVKSAVVTKNSKIHVTFNQNYLPATRYWVESVKDHEGFVLRLDIHVSLNPEFNWWVTN